MLTVVEAGSVVALRAAEWVLSVAVLCLGLYTTGIQTSRGSDSERSAGSPVGQRMLLSTGWPADGAEANNPDAWRLGAPAPSPTRKPA
jgi:hypothetical protein